jgi:PAS domain S-box-containing protein
LDPEGNISSINPSFSKLLGYRMSNIKDKPVTDLIKSDADGTSLIELITRRPGEGVTKNLMVDSNSRQILKARLRLQPIALDYGICQIIL